MTKCPIRGHAFKSFIFLKFPSSRYRTCARLSPPLFLAQTLKACICINLASSPGWRAGCLFEDVSKQAKALCLAVVISGFSLAAWTLLSWRPGFHVLPRLGLYTLAAMATSRLKVRLPGIISTLSMNYVFFIAGQIDLGLGGGILIATSGVLVQTFFRCAVRPQWLHVIFNLANIWLAVSAAALCFEHPILQSIDRFGIFSVVISLLAYYAVNTVNLSGIIGLTSGRSAFAVWRESYLWTFPQYLVGGIVADCFHLLVDYIGWAGVLFTFPVIYLVYRTYTLYLARVDEQQKHIGEMADLHLRTIEALALAIDAKDDTTSAHLRRVQVYASEVARQMGVTPLEMQAIEAAALLHDIGKLAVPEHIISKPGRLTPDEFEKMKIHPIVGAEILDRVNFPYPVVPIVRAHHERYNGTGYPDGLKGNQIPIGARILSVVDCLDALASDRQYRKALPLDEAVRIVVKESGQSFDPQVVQILQDRYQELEARAKSETADNTRLSSRCKVERSAEPAAGFAIETSQPRTTDNFRLSISDARREFQMLLEITNDLGSSLSLDETLALLAIRLEKAIPYDSVVIWVRQGDKLIPRHVKGESYRLFNSLRIPIGQGLSGWVAENKQAIINGNPAVESGYLNDPSKLTILRSAIAVPLECRDQVVGVLTLYQVQPDAFTSDHRRILQNITAKVGAVIDNALQFEQVKDAARTDELTGLLNSRSLFEQLGQAVTECTREGRSLAVIVMDLDGFKKANDERGHLAGNRILQNVAGGLKRICRATDVVARLGGDEFVMVVSDPADGLPELMKRITEAGLAAGTEVNYKTPISISAGCALFPQEAVDAENLLEKADERMYEEKRRRKAAPHSGNVIVFPKTRGVAPGVEAAVGS
jgi:diguanylate cyclase (GGDEF)-like protein/putative nucleotidyltransferase with HDIG domain